MKCIFIGDSLTYGYGVYRDQCFVTLISKRLGIDTVNRGINGDTTAGVLLRLYEDVVQMEPTHAVVMIGTNDMLMNYSMNQIQNNVQSILKEILDNDIVPVLAIQPPIIGEMAVKYWDSSVDYERVHRDLIEYRQWVKNFANENGIAFIDFYESFDKRRDLLQLYLDGVHLNAEGHKYMAEVITSFMLSIKNNK